MFADPPPTAPVRAGVTAPALRIASPSTKEVTSGQARDLNGGLAGTPVVAIRAPRDARFPAQAHFYVFRLGRHTAPLITFPPEVRGKRCGSNPLRVPGD